MKIRKNFVYFPVILMIILGLVIAFILIFLDKKAKSKSEINEQKENIFSFFTVGDTELDFSLFDENQDHRYILSMENQGEGTLYYKIYIENFTNTLNGEVSYQINGRESTGILSKGNTFTTFTLLEEVALEPGEKYSHEIIFHYVTSDKQETEKSEISGNIKFEIIKKN